MRANFLPNSLIFQYLEKLKGHQVLMVIYFLPSTQNSKKTWAKKTCLEFHVLKNIYIFQHTREQWIFMNSAFLLLQTPDYWNIGFQMRSIKWVPRISGNLVVKSKLPPCNSSVDLRQLNPSHKKGSHSLFYIDKIITKIVSLTNVNQWKNSTSVIEWYKVMPNKDQYRFSIFDIDIFYPSILL